MVVWCSEPDFVSRIFAHIQILHMPNKQTWRPHTVLSILTETQEVSLINIQILYYKPNVKQCKLGVDEVTCSLFFIGLYSFHFNVSVSLKSQPNSEFIQ